MYNNNNRFKKLKIKIKKKEKKKNRNNPQKCKSPMQRQRFLTTIKNVTEEEKLKSLVRFHSANKINSYHREGERQSNLQNKSRHKNNKCFSCVTSVRVLSLAGSHSPPHLPKRPSNTADLWTCCGGSSDSNLVLLLCILASNVRSYQS